MKKATLGDRKMSSNDANRQQILYIKSVKLIDMVQV